MKHLIFHKYKWETYSRHPIFVSGFFQDYTLEKRYQYGECGCGAYKYREIEVNTELEREIAMSEFIIKSAKEAKDSGDIETAIKILS